MAFRELMEGLKLPEGASDRYRKLEALGRMLDGSLYDDLKYSFEQEKVNGRPHIPMRERRPSVDFNLAYEITQDTLAELFGDEQFPVVQITVNGKADDAATECLAGLLDVVDLQQTLTEAYEEGVVGGVGVVVHKSDDGTPFYEILPAKWCEPIYRSPVSRQLAALVVTYPISAGEAEMRFPGITDEQEGKGVETFWYRYVIGPETVIEYRPLSDIKYAKLGEPDQRGDIIEFVEHKTFEHGFSGVTPAVYVKNLGGSQRAIDGPALWWPIRNICIEIDYNLSQAGRGLRYSADPMLFVRQGDLFTQDDSPAGYDKPAGGMATNVGESGEMVKGATQTLVGHGQHADAKLLEISAKGITEEREFVKDLREYALEVIGGMKARAEHATGPTSGRAMDKSLKPLRRLVRRQRRPYGSGLLLSLIDLTLYGFACGALEQNAVDVDFGLIPENANYVPEWPNDETLQGQDLFYHVEGLQLAAGGSLQFPLELIKPEAMGAKLSADLGMHQPYDTIKGHLEVNGPETEPTT